MGGYGYGTNRVLKGLMEAAESLGKREFFSRDLVKPFEELTGWKYSSNQIGHYMKELEFLGLLERRKIMVQGGTRGYTMLSFKMKTWEKPAPTNP